MNFKIVTALPQLLEGPLNHSIMQRGQDKGLLQIELVNLREYGVGPHKHIDDYQFGGGAGMVMMCEPLASCIEDLCSKAEFDEIIYLTPDGEKFNQKLANQLSLKKNIMLICGHYKGIDERIREKYVSKEISIGDYVLSGGELAAAVVVDSVGRLLPGVLNNETSALLDSFQDGLLAPPVYTRPRNFKDMEVPEVLLSGNDAAIENWRYEMSLERTKKRRPDILEDND